MPIITIEVKHGCCIVRDGKLARSRLSFQACGLDVYTKGSSTDIHEDCIPNIVMNECLSRHIPLISLRRTK